ncbi:hypothetical protein [Plasmodium yoelii yoelii]|uniref:Uncharacterized protein n=1 Tax=Plasmodium yoelii yoelii TaxID=73239 RepID=Q7RSC1_PLAYO|nr:hypothetical protein [Plasmodium yoelii yoelii]
MEFDLILIFVIILNKLNLNTFINELISYIKGSGLGLSLELRFGELVFGLGLSIISHLIFYNSNTN